jgi:hypothetical protein
MPLTKFQLQLAQLLASNRSPESHLAGGAALNFSPQSHRYSNDLDYFHDSVERVAEAFTKDSTLLNATGYEVDIKMNQPGFIRALVSKGNEATKVEWSHDSAWRFMPTMRHPDSGFQLHPIDIAVNKTLALAGRNEPRDFLDVIFLNRDVLSLGALCWAASGKDPGFTPTSLLEILKRRGKYQPEDFRRLNLNTVVDLVALKSEWRDALEAAEQFIQSRPAAEIGCLYYSPQANKFVTPGPEHADAIPHWGCPGGVLPTLQSEPFDK